MSYRREALIQSSGRSQVWRARDSGSGAPCVLKMAPRLAGFGIVHEATITDALRERCGHATRGLLLPIGSFFDADRLVLVLPWVELGDAAAGLSTVDPKLESAVAGDEDAFLWRVTADLCMGLATMHAHGE